jgi:hypothetical protein
MNKLRSGFNHTLVVLALSLLTTGWAGATDITSKKYIGSMREAEGRILMDRGGREVFVRRGMRVFKQDTIRSEDDGKGAVVFRDETSVRFGPNSTISLDDFEYAPEDKKFGLEVGIAKGLAVVVTGALAKSDPESMAFNTPKGTIGIRGTKFSVKVEE